jgi:hypothetical protein
MTRKPRRLPERIRDMLVDRIWLGRQQPLAAWTSNVTASPDLLEQRLIPRWTRLPTRSASPAVYNAEFIHHAGRVLIMEAEQLNIIANRLVDLGQRATELRRYL